jgi:hypothetical protein
LDTIGDLEKDLDEA